VNVSGTLLPYHNGEPVLLRFFGAGYLYLPLFSTEERLREIMARIGAPFDQIKQVNDGPDFMESLPARLDERQLQVIMDPHFLENGRIRFLQIPRPAGRDAPAPDHVNPEGAAGPGREANPTDSASQAPWRTDGRDCEPC
jgi:hypothetical protein